MAQELRGYNPHPFQLKKNILHNEYYSNPIQRFRFHTTYFFFFFVLFCPRISFISDSQICRIKIHVICNAQITTFVISFILCLFFLTKLDVSTGLIKVCNFCTVKKKYRLVLQKKVGRVLISMLLLSPFISCNFSRCKKKGIMDG